MHKSPLFSRDALPGLIQRYPREHYSLIQTGPKGAYKRKFGVTQLPLLNITRALSWRGKPLALRDRIVRELRRYPRLSARISRALARQSMRGEY